MHNVESCRASKAREELPGSRRAAYSCAKDRHAQINSAGTLSGSGGYIGVCAPLRRRSCKKRRHSYFILSFAQGLHQLPSSSKNHWHAATPTRSHWHSGSSGSASVPPTAHCAAVALALPGTQWHWHWQCHCLWQWAVAGGTVSGDWYHRHAGGASGGHCHTATTGSATERATGSSGSLHCHWQWHTGTPHWSALWEHCNNGTCRTASAKVAVAAGES